MATGSITTLGVGSGLDLQNILEQLKEAEKAPITAKETQKTTLKSQINAYNSVNTKLFSIKSDALSLSLESDFLKNTISISDEDVLTATVNDGIAQSSQNLEVVQKAQYSSWQSAGIAGKDSISIPPPDTDITSLTQAVTTTSEPMTIKFGALENQKDINISLYSGMNLTQVIEAVNTSESNKDTEGNPMVTASLGQHNGEYYIRIADATGGKAVDTQVSVEGFDYVATDKTISIATTSGSDPMFLNVAPGTTFEQLTADINAASDNPGVTATLINTGTATDPYRLTLTANATGEDHRITQQNMDAFFGMTEVTGAGEGTSLNAILKVNGVEYQRQSNEAITDVITGVTLNLKKTGEATVGIQKNTESIKDSIKELVEGVNELIKEINGSEDEEEDANPLAEDYNVKNVLSSLRSLLTTYTETDSPYKSLVDLGLEVNQDGSLELDETVLDQALAADPDAIQSLFIGDEDAGIEGLGDIINNGITDMVSTAGIVTTQIDEAEARVARLDEEIRLATERLDKQYATMTADFVRLDKVINQLNNESSLMDSLIESYNNTMNNN